MNKRKIIIGISILIIILFSHFLNVNKNKETKYTIPPVIQKENSVEKSPEIETEELQQINTGIKTYLSIDEKKYETNVNKEISVYSLMNQMRNEGKINFKERTYAGIGKFILELNGVKSDGSKYWIYYVNEVKAKVGVSDYKINPGDNVSWKYEKDEN